MVTSTAALLLVMHLCSDTIPGGGGVRMRREKGGGWHTTCGQTNVKGDSAALSSPLTCRPWSTLEAIHNNTQADHYMRDTADGNKQAISSRGQQEAIWLTQRLRSKVRTSGQRKLSPCSLFSASIHTEICFYVTSCQMSAAFPPNIPTISVVTDSSRYSLCGKIINESWFETIIQLNRCSRLHQEKLLIFKCLKDKI